MKKLVLIILAISIITNSLNAVQKVDRNNSFDFVKIRSFTGKDLQEIAFPIGGVATGNILLGGRGDIRGLEIFNKPAKSLTAGVGNVPETFFSLWVKKDGEQPVVKILERKLLPPYAGWMGVPRTQLGGVSRFKEVIFKGEYPFAYLTYKDENIPIEVNLEAYNPFIPLSPKRSGIPAAIFNWKFKNPTNSSVKVSIAFSMPNPIQSGNKKDFDFYNGLYIGDNINEYVTDGINQGIYMYSNSNKESDLEFGSLAFATTSEEDVDVKTRWYRGIWFDKEHIFWDDFSDDGRIENCTEKASSKNNNTFYWNPKYDIATVLVSLELMPNEEKTVPFYFSWFFPNRKETYSIGKTESSIFRNYYATQFKNAWDVIKYLTQNIKNLYKDTKTFHDIIFSSTFPSYVIDAITSQMSSIKTNLAIRDEEGRFYGWEGLRDDAGCCFGSCTHVWNYAQTLAYLFPSLARSMHEITLLHDTFDNGYQTYRTIFPPENRWFHFRPAADGQMGNIITTYREWKLSGDTKWLRNVWPKVKASLEYAWKGVGKVKENLEWQKNGAALPWDPNKDGVMEGQQHNTYDVDFYGPNTMVGANYLGALKAASEMAKVMGEDNKSKEYFKLFQRGSKKYDQLLWNGEYYYQKVDVLDGLKVPKEWQTPNTDEEIIPKYQYGKGCLSDQLMGQYLAFSTGLGYLLNKTHVDYAMKSIFKYNFKTDFNKFSNVQRIYAINDEKGLLLCTWPKGDRPVLPFIYSDEVWTGVEYQVAASLIYTGHIEEGLTIVKAVRDRYSGFNRNPWDEIECGHNYARAMSSWAIMLALSGYQYDGVNHIISFSPKINKNNFKTFWSSGNGWGSFTIEDHTVTIKVEYGSLKILKLGISKDYNFKSIACVNGISKNVRINLKKSERLLYASFKNTVELKRGDYLSIVFK